jgi:two-component system OmpR family response regulator
MAPLGEHELAALVLPERIARVTRRLLVIEDDRATRDYVANGFQELGWTVERQEDGRDGLALARHDKFDLIILDRNLPGLDGLELLRTIRTAGVETPVIILSAIAQVDERVKGLRAGGDDYVTKPFHFSELHARADVVLKRKAPAMAMTTFSCADLTVDIGSRRVTRGGREIVLLPREFKLLEYFMRHKEQVVTRTMLLEHVWDYSNEPHQSIIDTHISRLRKKIDEGFDVPLLHTVRGVGYRLSTTP